jgi:hypothetical protein
MNQTSQTIQESTSVHLHNELTFKLNLEKKLLMNPVSHVNYQIQSHNFLVGLVHLPTIN